MQPVSLPEMLCHHEASTQHKKIISEESIKILNIFLEQHFELLTDVTNVPDLR